MKEEMFVLVEASKLSLDDEFMRHVPKTPEECKLKTQLETVIKRGIANFYRPRMDPAFDGTYNIFFNSGLKPAVGRNGYWWLTNAKKYAPERKSRLGTNSEYIAFLGVLIKMLIAKNWTMDEAWHAVCNDSKSLGNYRNSLNAYPDYESTGSREVVGFCDLANTWKLLSDDGNSEFWLAGGHYFSVSTINPLADLRQDNICFDNLVGAVGWIVMEC